MVNKVILVGRLGKDPEARSFEGGTKKVSFTLATDEKYKDKNGEKQKRTEWHNIGIWGKLADIAEQYLKKGSLLYVEGRISSRQYDDKDGNKKYFSEIIADNFQMLDSKGGDQSANSGSVVSSNTAADETTNQTDDLPF